MNFTRDEMETMWQVYTNETARLTKRLMNETELDPVIRGVIENRIEMLKGITTRLLKELNKG